MPTPAPISGLPARRRRYLVAALAGGFAALGLSALPAAADAVAPSIATDQADYAPGDTVTLTGAGWTAGESVHVKVDDDDSRTWSWSDDATAGDDGTFVDQVVLPDRFVANYSVTATGVSGGTASTTFTDSNVQVAAAVGSTKIAADIAWTVYKKDKTCSGLAKNSGTTTTVTSGFTGAAGAGQTAVSLLAPAQVVIGSNLYAFHDWSGAVSATNNLLCVPGDAGSGKINEQANYTLSGTTSKQTQSITFATLDDKTYGDPDFSVSATASSGLTVAFSASGPCTVTGTTVHLTGTGDCTITADQAGNATYLPATSVARTFTVGAAAVTVTVSCPTSVVYSGSAQTPCTAAATGAGGLNQALSPTYSANIAVGTATATADYAGDATHPSASNSATFAITPASSSITFSCPAHVTFDGSAQTPCSATVSGAGGLSLGLTPSYTDNVHAGTAQVSAAFGGDANHAASSDSTTFTIDKAPSTTTLTCPTSVAYTGSAQTPCAADVSGAGGLSTAVTPQYSANTAAGTASVSASYAGDGDHVGSSDATTFAISKAASVVGLSCPTDVTYDGSAQEPCTATVTGAGGLSQNLTVHYSANTDAGTATASASYGGDGNHESGNAQTTFTIDRAPSSVTVTCDSGSVFDGTAQTPCTASVSGVGGLSATLPVDYTDNVHAGTAGAAATFLGDANHTGNGASTTFDIAKAASAVEVSCTGPVVFDATAQAPCSAQVSGAGGLAAPVDVVYPTDHTSAGAVHVTATYAGDGDHLGSSGNGSFTILKAPSSTAIQCPVSVVYSGAARTPCTAGVTGVGGLDQTLTVHYAGNVDTGTATATASYAGDANHEASDDTRQFVIDPAPSTTTVTCTDVTYTGAAQTPCSATVTGAGGLSQSVPVTYTANTDAGTAGASASYSGDSNHTGSNGSANFAIGKATLTVTPDGKSMTFGDQVPALTYGITGYVGGQTAATSGVAGTASCTTTAQYLSPQGSYPISCVKGTLAAANYTFAFASAFVTVGTKAATLGYTGSLFWPTAAATATTASVTLQATVTPGTGGTPDLRLAKPITFSLYKSTNLAMTQPDVQCTTTTVSTAGVANCTIAALGVDNWTVVAHLGDPGTDYYTAADSDPVVLTVYQPATDAFATGGGWVTDPGTDVSPANRHGNFGFTVRYKSGTTPSGQAVFVYRGANGYDYVVKSNSWQGGGLSFGKPTGTVGTTSFSGKCNVTVIDRVTGAVVTGLGGGGYTFRVDATDLGSPGSSDSYAISVYNSAGVLYHQAGTAAKQLVLGGGNVVVHGK